MNAFLNYIIEANIGLVLFLACYQLLLRGETNFRLLRIFLLTGIFASLTFPLVHTELTGGSPLSLGQVLPAYRMPGVIFADPGTDSHDGSSIGLWKFCALIYGTGVVLLSVQTTWALITIFRTIKNARRYRFGKYKISESPERKPTFSFFNLIFIGGSNQLSTAEKRQIIEHEIVHASQGHSLDVMLIHGLNILFWFNPFVSIYKNILVQLHEFDADRAVVSTSDADKYCSLLAKVALQSAGFSLANHFNKSLTLKRIDMIRSIKNKIRGWKIVAWCMLIPVVFLLLSCQDQFGQAESSDVVYREVPEVLGTATVVEPASPEGGTDAFYNTIRKNITYPAESRRNHKYGTVFLQFVVNEDGSLSDIQPLDAPDKALGDEALRMMSLSPKWIPAKKEGVAVKQSLVLPIVFKLDFPGRENHQEEDKVIEVRGTPLQKLVVVGYANK
jgi:TonB family protein